MTLREVVWGSKIIKKTRWSHRQVCDRLSQMTSAAAYPLPSPESPSNECAIGKKNCGTGIIFQGIALERFSPAAICTRPGSSTSAVASARSRPPRSRPRRSKSPRSRRVRQTSGLRALDGQVKYLRPPRSRRARQTMLKNRIRFLCGSFSVPTAKKFRAMRVWPRPLTSWCAPRSTKKQGVMARSFFSIRGPNVKAATASPK